MASRSSEDIYAETLAVFDRTGRRYEPLTTPEVAAALDANRRTVYKRLRKLVDRGELETKETGSNSRVWWRPADPSDGRFSVEDGQESGPDRKPPGERFPGRPDGTGGRRRARPDATGVGGMDPRSRVMESAIDGMAIIDEDGEYVRVNETHAEVYGYDGPEAFVGEHWRMCYGEAELARFEDEILPTLDEEGAWRGEAVGRRKGGTTFPQDLSLTVADDGSMICVVRDITDRRARERRLRDARKFNEELVENAPFGMFRLDEDLRITYENPRAEEIIGLPDEKESSEAIGVRISELPPIVETGQADLFERLPEGETIEFDFPFESIYGKEAYFTGRAVPVYRDDEFDGAILMATDISERRQYERELERQREQLAALDELNSVVRGITEAVLDQSTREEIEHVACDRLAESDSYRCAWIGTIDSGRGLAIRTESGVDGLPDDAQAPTACGPSDWESVEKAVRAEEMRITRNAVEDPDSERPPERTDESGSRSTAVIPIVHQGVCYGVLGVCSTRADAFAEKEREVVGQLGDVIGHAIAAVDRKRALMSDEVVELEVRLPTPLDSSDVAVDDETISIERMTPVGDGEYLVYGTATAGAVETLHALEERLPICRDTRTFDETNGEVRFEHRLSDPPMTSFVADHGGNFETGRIEDGAYSATIQFPTGTDIRRVVSEIREAYPDLEVVSQRQVARQEPSSRQAPDVIAADLTERQRAALEAGYFGGFFECPRHRSGEEVADSLDIEASTFHQHVRRAEKKLLDAVFADG